MTKQAMTMPMTHKRDSTQMQQIVCQDLNDIVETLVMEGRINLRNFGLFQVRKCKPRLARNPRTGEKVAVPGRTVVTFKPGREMEERICHSQRHDHAPVW
jgi:DNA-binding protein HU-beta/integration host factor subunit beta